MRAAASLLAGALALVGCGEQTPETRNGPAEVEALPADESAATTSEELANGVNDPDVNDLGNQH